jgi:leucyl aminopeptidase
MGGAIKRAIATSEFQGKKGTVKEILLPPKTRLDRVLLLGIGDPEKLDALAIESLGGAIYAHTAKLTGPVYLTVGPVAESKLDSPTRAAHLALGVKLRAYRFDKYRTKEKKEDKPRLKRVTILVDGAAAARKAFAPMAKVAEGVLTTRDLVSEPPNVIYPDSFAQQAKTLKDLGVDVEVLDEKQMAKLGMGALLGVAQGSAFKPRLVVMRWNGATRDTQPVTFIGKGVTFDTGGISIKPANGMWDMKWDMGGAGVVVGLMRALAGRKAKVNAVGVCALVENMPDGNAQRPGDIVRSMSGQTIEVLNTDAEGRLILADALWYTQERFKPQFMVNLATLTGAIIVSLGNVHAGLFSNNDELSQRLTDAGKKVDELLWRLPLADAYDRMLDSDAADMKNIGDGGAGSITAAQFLQRFVNKVPWAQLDISGTTW